MDRTSSITRLFDALAGNINWLYGALFIALLAFAGWRVTRVLLQKKREREAWERLSWEEKEKLKKENFLR